MKPKSKTRKRKGWTKIAEFLGQPVSVAQRWQSGMPVAVPDNAWRYSKSLLLAWE